MIISFIIPVNNKISLNFFKRQFQKKIKITKFVGYEVIVVFDGKPSRQILSLIKKKITNNFTFYILKRKIGPGIARNVGIKKSRGKKIVFLDIDDDINFSELNNLYKVCTKHDEKLIGFNYMIINNKSKTDVLKKNENFLKSKNKIKYLLKKNLYREILYYVFDKNFLIKNEIFFKKGVYEDLFFMFKFFVNFKKKIYIYKNILGNKNNTKKSITNSINTKYIKDKIIAWIDIRSYLKDVSFDEKLIQYRLRSEFYDALNAKNKIKNKVNRNKLNKYLLKNIDQNISRNFRPKTIKDRYLKKILNEI